MKKIEEIIEENRLQTNHWADQEFNDFGICSVEAAMKEYAEYYAQLCLKKFKLECEPVYDMQGEFVGYEQPYLETFKLPEHE